MQELLSRNRDCSKPSHGEQFIELSLSDVGNGCFTHPYCVKETLYHWDAIKKQVTKDIPQLYPFATTAEARNWYDRRRDQLVRKGFKYSDLDW